ncbi:hypothetical protein [Glutamicibacter sp.]|jgi:hypothetical protein|uniref:hypothetical protein n=1 Tax=Glutamicibacter sp. TaxID=1931995 RepID=UPI002B482207|nr:hypothetical protein [Glutamicibacter sp.]HJX78124.1 hypothetical protein [Glutamicibacter sp.]
MSKPRKSSAALAAREKARAKAEEITRRNEELIELAAGFFVHEDQLAKIDEDTEQKIAELRTVAQQKKATSARKAMEVVGQMLATGESKKSIGERLGLTNAELKIYLPAVPAVQDGGPGTDGAKKSAPTDSGAEDSGASASN